MEQFFFGCDDMSVSQEIGRKFRLLVPSRLAGAFAHDPGGSGGAGIAVEQISRFAAQHLCNRAECRSLAVVLQNVQDLI